MDYIHYSCCELVLSAASWLTLNDNELQYSLYVLLDSHLYFLEWLRGGIGGISYFTRYLHGISIITFRKYVLTNLKFKRS